MDAAIEVKRANMNFSYQNVVSADFRLTKKQASELADVSPRTWDRWRVEGIVPPNSGRRRNGAATWTLYEVQQAIQKAGTAGDNARDYNEIGRRLTEARRKHA